MVLKQRNKLKEDRHQFNFNVNKDLGLPDLVEAHANRFGEFIGTALRYLSQGLSEK